ncbi:Vha36-1 [Nucleospora cyclopteri]
MKNTEKLPVFATRMNHKIISHRLITAQKGFRLLKTKSDALNLHFRKIEEKYNLMNADTYLLFKEAFLSLSKAQFLGANMEMLKKDSQKYPILLKSKIIMFSGVTLPHFQAESNFDFEDVYSRGSLQFIKARDLLKKLVILLVDICSIKNSYSALKKVLDITNRRVNALEYFLIPRLENTLKFISSELDEQERENFFRLKKIQNLNSSKKANK